MEQQVSEKVEAATTGWFLQEEIKRVQGDGLPSFLAFIAGATIVICLVAGFIMVLTASSSTAGSSAESIPRLVLGFTIAVSGVVTGALLFGFADVVRSLRTITRRTLGHE